MATAVEYPESMLATGLFKPFSHIDFNDMRNMDNKSVDKPEPNPEQLEKALTALSHVLVKHEMHELLGITLVHNHFSLGKGEIVLTEIDPKSRLNIRSCMNDELKAKADAPVYYLRAIEGEPGNGQVPYMWAYDKASNAFFSMQFFNANRHPEIVKRYEQLSKHENLASFLMDYSMELKKQGMQNDLGLFLIYQDLVPIDQETEILYEITDKDTRQQVLFITTKEQVNELMMKHGSDNMVYTNWTAHRDAKTGAVWFCVGSCCTRH
jgi:hypothetical protein